MTLLVPLRQNKVSKTASYKAYGYSLQQVRWSGIPVTLQVGVDGIQPQQLEDLHCVVIRSKQQRQLNFPYV